MSADTSAFSIDDTIVAIATAAGPAAIGVVRVSGPDAHGVAMAMLDREEPLEPRRASLTRLRSREGDVTDEVVALYFQAPRSYTGQDLVELSVHGSQVTLRAVLAAASGAGARLARPGEFTLRAFLNGKRDLVQAEAVADLVSAVTPLQARTAFDQLQGTLSDRIAAIDRRLFDLVAGLEASLDFPDEGYHFAERDASVAALGDVIDDIDRLLAGAGRGRMIRDGVEVVIAGRTNVGKSQLFNALSGADRAIVTDVAGTTRDLLTERVDLDGVLVTLVDTAGSRATEDRVEIEGLERARRAREAAELVVLVIDRSEALRDEDHALLCETAGRPRVLVANKCDLKAVATLPQGDVFIASSARTGVGLDDLRRAIAGAVGGGIVERETPALSNVRHITLMREAREHLQAAQAAMASRTPEEFVLSHLHEARTRFDQIVGLRTSDDVLARIFERFCIGK